jgi:hypothetical protein
MREKVDALCSELSPAAASKSNCSSVFTDGATYRAALRYIRRSGSLKRLKGRTKGTRLRQGDTPPDDGNRR